MIIRFIQKYRRFIALSLGDILFFGFFNPNQSSWLLFPAFGLLMTTVYVLIRGVLELFGQFVAVQPLLRKKVTVFGTFVVGVILVLQSLGQLTVRDVITVVPLIAILYLYVSYFTLKPKQ